MAVLSKQHHMLSYTLGLHFGEQQAYAHSCKVDLKFSESLPSPSFVANVVRGEVRVAKFFRHNVMLSDLLQGLRITFYLQLSYKLKKGKIKKNKFKGPRTSFYIATVLLHLLLRTYITSNISECFLTYMFVYILPVLGDVGKGLNPLLLLSA